MDPECRIYIHVFLWCNHTNMNNYSGWSTLYMRWIRTYARGTHSQNKLNMNRMPYLLPRSVYSTCRVWTRDHFYFCFLGGGGVALVFWRRRVHPIYIYTYIHTYIYTYIYIYIYIGANPSLLFPPACVCVPLDAAVTSCNVKTDPRRVPFSCTEAKLGLLQDASRGLTLTHTDIHLNIGFTFIISKFSTRADFDHFIAKWRITFFSVTVLT